MCSMASTWSLDMQNTIYVPIYPGINNRDMFYAHELCVWSIFYTVKSAYKEHAYKELSVIIYKELIFIPQERDFASSL